MNEKIEKKEFEKLLEKYPFLIISENISEYLDPNYYNEILKDYIFNGISDLEIFNNWFTENLNKNKNQIILELGCGSGRVTDETLKVINDKCKLDLLDLSNQMLDYCKEKYLNNKNVNFIKSDTFNYLKNTEKKYDIVYSLWSYSHSIHQILPDMGYDKGKEYVENTLKKFIEKNLNSNGKMFIIHFDSMSEEQSILIQEWKKLYEMFQTTNEQSPSFRITKNVLEELQKSNLIEYKIEHLIGEPIVYKNMNEALEVFLNFHMESEFNQLKILPEVIDELQKYFAKFLCKDNTISIKPGCFLISINRK